MEHLLVHYTSSAAYDSCVCEEVNKKRYNVHVIYSIHACRQEAEAGGEDMVGDASTRLIISHVFGTRLSATLTRGDGS